MYNSRHGHKDQQQVADLQKQYDLLRVTAATLSKLVSMYMYSWVHGKQYMYSTLYYM